MAVEHLLIALRTGRPEHAPEAEPVIVRRGSESTVVLETDDGETFEFDAIELRAAVEAA